MAAITHQDLLRLLEFRMDYYSARIALSEALGAAGLSQLEEYDAAAAPALQEALAAWSPRSDHAAVALAAVAAGTYPESLQEDAEPEGEVARPSEGEQAAAEEAAAEKAAADKAAAKKVAAEKAAADKAAAKKAAAEKAAADKAAAKKAAAEKAAAETAAAKKAAAEKAAADKAAAKKAAAEKAAADEAAAKKAAAEEAAAKKAAAKKAAAKKAAAEEAAADKAADKKAAANKAAPQPVTFDADQQRELSVPRTSPVRISTGKPGWLHWAVNDWQPVPDALRPQGSRPGPEGKATQSLLVAAAAGEGPYSILLGPFPADANVDRVDFNFQYDDGTWADNHQVLYT